jgi:hypothetical protein
MRTAVQVRAVAIVLLAFAITAASAQVAAADVVERGGYSKYWTNGVNDTLLIYAAIEYDTVTRKGWVAIYVECWKGNPANRVANRCKLKGGTKVWENYTTGGHISGTIGEKDFGHTYYIPGTPRSMVDTNSYNSRAKDIYVLFHGSGRTSAKHTACSVPWSERYGTGAGPAC